MARYLLNRTQTPGRAALAIAHALRVEQIAAAIERYLLIHPAAADSVVGITQWWLPVVGVEADCEEVEKALMLLQTRGVVESVFTTDRQRFWRLTGAVIEGDQP